MILQNLDKNSESQKYNLSHFLNKYASSNIIGMDKVFVRLSDNYYAKGKAPLVSSENLLKITESADNIRKVLIGTIFPNITTYTQEDSRFFSPNTSVKKIFKNGKYTLGLQWQHMNMGFMNANQQRITTYGKDFYTTTNYIYETDVFQLNFSVSLNNLKTKTKLPPSEIGEKEF